MTDRISDPVNAILLDIEGTTTPVDFVFGVLFPFAREEVAPFLAQHGQEPAVQSDLAQLRQEYEADRHQGLAMPRWEGADPGAAVEYVQYLIAVDRKSTGLKSLQGKIWSQGYAAGTLRSQLFTDVEPALRRWHAAGKQIFIFSSGSIQAQQLLFANTEFGDLSPLLKGYFDTTTGPKKVPESYRAIAAQMGLPPGEILFISDVPAELQAAQAAGMKALFSCRPGNPIQDSEGFTPIETFEFV